MMLFLWILVGLLWTVICVAVGYLGGRESIREEIDEAQENLYKIRSGQFVTIGEAREMIAKNSPEPKPCSFTDKEQGELSLLSKTVFDLVQAVHNMDNQDEIDHALEVVKAYESRLKRVERKTGLNT